MEIDLEDRFFSIEISFCFQFLLQNPKSVFQNFNPNLQIESTQNLGTLCSPPRRKRLEKVP